LWRTKLKSSDFVNVVLDDNALYAASSGQLFCLDPATGTIRWRNKLAGLGWGLVTIAAPGGSQPVWMEEQNRQAARNTTVST
jgi:outer membrane protein assembly factor BamB